MKLSHIALRAAALCALAASLSACVVRPGYRGYGYRRGYYGRPYARPYYAPRPVYVAPRPVYVPPPAPAY